MNESETRSAYEMVKRTFLRRQAELLRHDARKRPRDAEMLTELADALDKEARSVSDPIANLCGEESKVFGHREYF